jgi:hypothetical protein
VGLCFILKVNDGYTALLNFQRSTLKSARQKIADRVGRYLEMPMQFQD